MTKRGQVHLTASPNACARFFDVDARRSALEEMNLTPYADRSVTVRNLLCVVFERLRRRAMLGRWHFVQLSVFIQPRQHRFNERLIAQIHLALERFLR